MNRKMFFHHIGIACEDIDEMTRFMNRQFDITDCTDIIYDSNQNAKLCMLEIAKQTKIELISGEMVNSIVKKKSYLYHICYEVDDIEKKTVELCKNEGYLKLSEIKPACLFGGKKVVFLAGNLGIIELLESGDRFGYS